MIGLPGWRPEEWFVHYTNLVMQRFGAPGGTRTPNSEIRTLLLYPIELQAQRVGQVECLTERWDLNPPGDLVHHVKSLRGRLAKAHARWFPPGAPN